MSELQQFPDIKIKYFENYIEKQTYVTAELILNWKDVIRTTASIPTEELLDKNFKKYLEERLLKEISYKYIKRSFDKRKNKEVTVEADSFLNTLIHRIREEKIQNILAKESIL